MIAFESSKPVKHLLVTALVAFVLVLLLAACGPSTTSVDRSARLPSPTVDPWDIAVDTARDVLNGAPQLEQHLVAYKSTASEISEKLSVIENAQSGLRIVDDLRNTDLPLVGNAWNLLVQALEAAAPGAGQGLETVESGLRDLVEFKHTMDALQGLEPLARSISRFRQKPSATNLVSLANAFDVVQPEIESAGNTMDDIIQSADNIVNSGELVKQGLQEAINVLESPIVRDAAHRLDQALAQLLGPVRELGQVIRNWREQSKSDLSVLQSIRKAESAAQRFKPVSGASSADAPAESSPDVAADMPSATSVPQSVTVPGPAIQESPTAKLSPERAVAEYWNAVSNGQYETAWSGLSAGFQQRAHDGDYTDYVRGYQKLMLCSVKATDTQVLEQSDSYAVVAAHLVYRAKSECTVSEYDFDFQMIYDPGRAVWLIDKLITRK